MSEATQKNIENLQKILGRTFGLYFQSQSYHWNVEGAQFRQLHEMFEEQYTNLFSALDEIAERIRILDEYAPASLTEMVALTGPEPAPAQTSDDMVSKITEANQALADLIRDAIPDAADSGDEVTAGLLGERLEYHEKTLWMLKASQR